MHSPSPLRLAFCEALEDYVAGETPPAAALRLYLAAGKVWNSTDRLPRAHHDDLECIIHWLDVAHWKRAGATYGLAGRLVRSALRSQLASTQDAILPGDAHSALAGPDAILEPPVTSS